MEAKLLEGDLLSWAPLWAAPAKLPDLKRLLSPEGLREAVRKHSLLLDLPGLSEAERWVEKDPLDLRAFPVARMLPSVTGLKFRAASRSFLAEDGKTLLVLIQGQVRSSNVDEVKALVAGVRRAEEVALRSMASLHPEAGAISAGHTGGYQFTVENEAVLRRDLTRNISFSILLVLLVLFWGWRSAVLVLLAGLPVAAAMLMGFGLFSLVRREVVSLAMVSGAFLAGLGIDYMIHVIEALREKGEVSREAVFRAVALTAPALILAAGTTAFAFLSFVLVSEGFLRDLGLLSALGICACLLTSVSVLPALLSLWKRGGGGRSWADARPSRLGLLLAPGALSARAAQAAASRPRVVLIATLASVVGGVAYLAWQPPRVEDDLRRLQDPDSEAMAVEARLTRTFGSYLEPVLLFVRAPDGPGASAGTTAGETAIAAWAKAPEGRCLEGLSRLQRELLALRGEGLVAGWHSALDFLPPPSDQEAVLELLSASPAEALQASFRLALEEVGFEPASMEGALETFHRALDRREPLTSSVLTRLGAGGFLPDLIRERGGTAFALVSVYPSGALWIGGDRERVFDALRGALARSGLSGEVSGIAAVSALAASVVVGEFLRATGFSLLVVVALVLVLFPRLSQALAALVPVLLGCLWTAVVWNALGFRLNLMNVGILPMLLGIGVDYGIHLVARSTALREDGVGVAEVFRSMAPAISLTVLTTLAGFGTLAFSTSRGLVSVGVLSSLGVIFCQLGSVVVLPALLSSRRTGT
jgi:predicted RND superfamily exporter protein